MAGLGVWGARVAGARAVGARLLSQRREVWWLTGPPPGVAQSQGIAPSKRWRPAERQPFPWETKLRFSSATGHTEIRPELSLSLDTWDQECFILASLQVKNQMLSCSLGLRFQ